MGLHGSCGAPRLEPQSSLAPARSRTRLDVEAPGTLRIAARIWSVPHQSTARTYSTDRQRSEQGASYATLGSRELRGS